MLSKDKLVESNVSLYNDVLKTILNLCPILPDPIPTDVSQPLIPVLTTLVIKFPYQESIGSNQPCLHSIHILANLPVNNETWLIDNADLEWFTGGLVSLLSTLLHNTAKGSSESNLFPMDSTVHGLPFADAILPFLVLLNGLATISKSMLKFRLFPIFISTQKNESPSLQDYLKVLIIHPGHSRLREQVEELVFCLFEESGK
jgi:hypothetical protein